MNNACPMLGVLSCYEEKFQDSDNYSKKDENLKVMDYSDATKPVPLINGMPDDSNDLIPDAEHEYRLHLRMLQYRLRDQPSELAFLSIRGTQISPAFTHAAVPLKGPTE